MCMCMSTPRTDWHVPMCAGVESSYLPLENYLNWLLIFIAKRGTYLCRTGELLESLYCKAFSGNATSHQQHWAVSVQKQPSNHSSVIGW